MSGPATLTTNTHRWPALRALEQPSVRPRASANHVSWFLAVVITGVMAATGITVLNRYFSTAPYRYDSAGYRADGIRIYDQCQTEGRWATACELLQRHNTFDVAVRLLLWPESLRHFHGHLYVQIPLMVLFCWLTLTYVQRQSGSVLLGVALLAGMFVFGTLYAPVNIMDYWKDNLATWMLGSALLCWFLSEHGQHRGWSLASGLFWGMLVLQRPVVAFYGITLFLPLLGYGVYRRMREDDRATFFRRAFAFAIMPLLLGGFAVVAQGESLYRYYVVGGYAYATPWTVAEWLLRHRYNDAAMNSAVLGGAALCLAVSWRHWRRRGTDLAVAVWLVAGFFGLIIATRALYPLWPLILTVLAVVSLSRLVPRHLSLTATRGVAVLLLLLMGSMAIVQARTYGRMTDSTMRRMAPVRKLFDEIAAIAQASPEPARPGLFFDEYYCLLWNQFYFDHGIQLPPTSFFMSTRDISYVLSYGDKPHAEIADSIITTMEQTPGALAIVNRDSRDLRRRLARAPYAKVPDGPAFQVNLRIGQQLGQRQGWEMIQQIDNETYGALLVYRRLPAHTSPATLVPDVAHLP